MARRNGSRGNYSSPRPSAAARKRSGGVITIVLAVIAAVLIIAIAFTLFFDPAKTEAPAEVTEMPVADETVQEPLKRDLTVTFAGDCTLGTDSAFDYSTSFNASFENHEPSFFLANVKDIFSKDDLTIVNMEGTLTTSTTRQDKTFAFKGDADYAKVFSTSSVEAASMANNHSMDYGQKSYDDTLEALDAEGIVSFGYDKIAYMDVNDVKVALIGTYELAEHEGIEESMVKNIEKARLEGAELVLVYIHWGIERETVPNATQMKLGHAAIDAGADLVVGSHPHVIQGYEKYKGRYIVYSLGNFCFGGNSNPADKDCMIFQQTFTIEGDEVEQNDDVEFIACSISSTSSYNNYQPTPATGSEKKRIDKKIKDSSDQIAAMAS